MKSATLAYLLNTDYIQPQRVCYKGWKGHIFHFTEQANFEFVLSRIILSGFYLMCINGKINYTGQTKNVVFYEDK